MSIIHFFIKPHSTFVPVFFKNDYKGRSIYIGSVKIGYKEKWKKGFFYVRPFIVNGEHVVISRTMSILLASITSALVAGFVAGTVSANSAIAEFINTNEFVGATGPTGAAGKNGIGSGGSIAGATFLSLANNVGTIVGTIAPDGSSASISLGISSGGTISLYSPSQINLSAPSVVNTTGGPFITTNASGGFLFSDTVAISAVNIAAGATLNGVMGLIIVSSATVNANGSQAFVVNNNRVGAPGTINPFVWLVGWTPATQNTCIQISQVPISTGQITVVFSNTGTANFTGQLSFIFMLPGGSINGL